MHATIIGAGPLFQLFSPPLHPFTSAYTLASHGKIGSRPTRPDGTSRSWVISRQCLPAGVAGQFGTKYSALSLSALAVMKSEKFATTTTCRSLPGYPRRQTITRLASLKSTWMKSVSLT